MSDPDPLHPEDAALGQTIARKAARRHQSRREGRHTVWFGIGMFGLVGWAVAVPAVAGTAVGIWLDGRFPGEPSWTLTGLVCGVLIGSLNAWWWVRRTGIQSDAPPEDEQGSADAPDRDGGGQP